ncbi:hypothetical protein CLCR_01730 [Cladophialophora carrionii]|uniref:Uncharacterized protein n=1 Tax=Cladophialophora carrionii TaxID=86049 RepID=A0A1C1CBE8_9EURO|nr:hypothetical protein CLCR_01730 [Cladophialophora carrionii]
MSMAATEDETLFNSTASITEPPRAYFSIPRPDLVLTIIDNPFRTRQSTVLVIIGVVALGICTVFLAVRYAQILRCNMHEHVKAPLTLEAQKSNRLGDDDKNEDYPGDRTPVTQSPDSYDDKHSSIRRRPRARLPQPKTIAIGGVREGKIAQRRASRSRSVGRDMQAPDDTLAMAEQV